MLTETLGAIIELQFMLTVSCSAARGMIAFHACHVIINGVAKASYAFGVRGGEN